MKGKPLFLRPLAAVASGFGIAALFPPYGFSQLIWIVLLPLLFALWSLGEGKRKRKAFGLGFLTGLAFFLPNLAWLRSVSDVGWAALSVYLALFPAVWSLFAATWGNPWRGEEKGLFHVPRHALACALVWTGLEWLRGWLFTGFGWNTLGTGFHQSLVFAQSADLLGAIGLSILPVFVQGVLLQVFVRRVPRFQSDGLGMRRRIALGSVVLVMVGAYGYGMWRMISALKADSIRLNALLVQLNIPQEAARQLWDATEIHLGYEDETLEALGVVDGETVHQLGGKNPPKPDWVLWPETALTGRIMRADNGEWATAQENYNTLDRIREGGDDFTLMLGVNEMEAEREGDVFMMKRDARVWNSLAVFPADGKLQTFRKHHLVIFGEYIPLVDKLPFLAKIYEQQAGVKYGGAFSMGESLDPLPVDIRGETVGVIPSVCFEDTVPRLLRKFVRNDGPQIIVNVTNDGWFKESPGAAQHFANARFRAIELRRPMIRCANTGVSAAITSTGSTVHPDGGRLQELRDAGGSHFTRGHLLTELDIPKNPPTTLYAIIGDWGVIVLAVVGVLLGAIPARRERKPDAVPFSPS
jgi:apolipoprotein N-acyltransferase